MAGPYCTMLGTYRWNPSLMVGTDMDAQSPIYRRWGDHLQSGLSQVF